MSFADAYAPPTMLAIGFVSMLDTSYWVPPMANMDFVVFDSNVAESNDA